MHPIDIQTALDSMVILCDSRERPTAAYKRRLASMGRPYERVALTSGDYSAKVTLPDGMPYSFADKVAIERKMSANEISGNFTRGRDRFKREFDRFTQAGGKLYLLIERADWGSIIRHQYDTQFDPKAFIASLMAWQARYNTHVLFCDPEDTGYLIERILYYEVKERLERGDADAAINSE